MVKKYLYLLAIAALTFSSCIKDDSTEGGDNVSVISLQTPLNSSYTLNQGDTLKIKSYGIAEQWKAETHLRMGDKS